MSDRDTNLIADGISIATVQSVAFDDGHQDRISLAVEFSSRDALLKAFDDGAEVSLAYPTGDTHNVRCVIVEIDGTSATSAKIVLEPA